MADEIEEVVETPSGQSPEVETPEVEIPEEEIPEAETPEVSEEETPEKPPSKRESLRIQKLIETIKTQTPATAPTPAGLDYTKSLEADPEVIARLEADRRQVGNAQYEAGLQRANSIQFHTRLEIDAPKIEAKYPVLDQTSPAFDSTVANAINQWYLATAGWDARTNTASNASVRYSEFVEGIMELADVLAGEKTQIATKSLASQVARTGIRPSGTAAKGLNLNKDAVDMTEEELDARLAITFPNKR